MKGSLPAGHQAQTLNAVVATLARCLDLDSGTLIVGLKQAEETRGTHAAAPAGLEEQCLGEPPVEEMDDEEEPPKLKKSEGAARADYDFSDLLPVNTHTHTHTFKMVMNNWLNSLDRDV